MVNTEKGAKLYASENEVYYYFEADKSKIEEGSAKQKPIHIVDEFVGTSTGEVSGEFVRVDWVQSWTDWTLNIWATDKVDAYKSWVLISTVKNTTTEQDDNANIEKTQSLLDKKTTLEKPKYTLIYVVIGVIVLFTGGVIWWKTSKNKKEAKTKAPALTQTPTNVIEPIPKNEPAI